MPLILRIRKCRYTLRQLDNRKILANIIVFMYAISNVLTRRIGYLQYIVPIAGKRGEDMKVAIMSGAFVNSGDFLIEQRSKELIESILCCDVDILKRNLAYDEKLDQLNEYDAIVFAGGPIFQPNIYPKRIPFVSNLQKIEAPIRIFGGVERAVRKGIV